MGAVIEIEKKKGLIFRNANIKRGSIQSKEPYILSWSLH